MEFPNPENPKLPGLCNISSVKGDWPWSGACSLELRIGLAKALVVALVEEWWNIGDGLMVVVVVAAAGGKGRFMEWLPLPRAAGTSWLCFPS